MQNEKNQAKKKSPRFVLNVVDLVLIIAVLACVVGVYLRYNLSENLGVRQELSDYVLSFKIENVRFTSGDAFPEGDMVFLAETNDQELGTILAIDSTAPSEVVFTDKEGDYRILYYPEDTRIDLTGRILSSGVMTERGYMLGGNTYLAPGQSYAVETPRIYVEITITDIVSAESAE